MMTGNSTDIPRGNRAGMIRYAKSDILSGFLVFLIALPLCLAIAVTSGFPPIAGLFTAIVGGLISPWISNSELTIKGPAAGMIVIVLGAVTDFSTPAFEGQSAYRLVLGVGVVAGLLQIVFALTRSGILGEFFPTSVVHGMLAAIGVIIMSNQIHKAMGVLDVKGKPFELIEAIPSSLLRLNPAVTSIGVISLAILFLMPFIKNPYLRKIPAPMIVIVVGVILGMVFDLLHSHSYTFLGKKFDITDKFLVEQPKSILSSITFPDFRGLLTGTGWLWVVLFSLIGTLESLLSAKAVDMLDPWKRKTDLNKDLLAVGVGNTIAASIGGFPMISEIVRSKANVDNGGHTRFANMFHGIFLLAFVAIFPAIIHRIPMASLSAMLIYTGSRLASPKEFRNVFRIGKEQFIIFVSTVVGVLATDLLVGVIIGIVVKFSIHALNGVPFSSFFKPFLDVETAPDGSVLIRAHKSAVFSNWIPFKKQIEHLGLVQKSNITIDFSDTRLVDHSVMEKLHELEDEFHREGLSLTLTGLDDHRKLSSHMFAARRKPQSTNP
jgi:MFS superfamily sulfate permease-like transporter